MLFAIQCLFDPRGRINRKGLLVLAVGLLALQLMLAGLVFAAGVAVDGPLVITLKLVFVWVALVAAAKRLHDLSISGWWIACAFILQIVWSVIVVGVLIVFYGIPAIAPGHQAYVIAMVATMAPIVAATLWMHFAIGDSDANAYGAVPDGLGFSHPNEQAELAHI